MGFLFFILLTSPLFSDIFHVPSEYPTIQEGINVAQEGDTVLVDQGIYYENPKITRSITLASNALFDDLSNWAEFDDQIFWQWQVTNEHINNTIIDGSTAEDDFGSTILIYPQDNECITPIIFGFTIQNGNGTYVKRPLLPSDSEDEQEYQRIGGGILFDISNPTIKYNKFLNNGSTNTHDGGGIYGTAVDEDWAFDNIPNNYFDSENNTMRCEVEEFDISNNFYNGNDALYGNSFANKGFEDTFNMSESIFDVANCGIEEVSPVWVYVEPEATLTLDNIESNLCATTASDVYVDPNIQQECIDDGCGTFNNPFKTITWALQMIMPSEDNIVTIHLAEGTYSPSTNGETFPIIMSSYVNIQGTGEDITILDAEQTGRVITMENCVNNIISDVTLTGGLTDLTDAYDMGGGINIYYSDPILTHVTIRGNMANGGGGIGIGYSTPTLTHVTIVNNTAILGGGGISVFYSDPTLTNVMINGNTVDYTESENLGRGGGILTSLSNSILIHVTIVNNTAINGGGIFSDSYGHPIVTNSIIWDNSSTSIYLVFWEPPIFTYSNIEGGWEFGEGNIDTDPLFTDPDNGDYTLLEGSPCIDAGTADIDGDGVDDILDYAGLAPDMGAFEWEPYLGDLNADGILDIVDVIIMVETIIALTYDPLGDMNNDGIVDIIDIIALINIILDN